MTTQVRCRVCGQHIGKIGWQSHVEAHKRQFCVKYNIPVHFWYKIKWEEVVKAYNPSEARLEKEPKPKIEMPQKTLGEFAA